MQTGICQFRPEWDEDNKEILIPIKAESQKHFVPLKLVLDALKLIDHPGVCELGSDEDADGIGIVRTNYLYYSVGGGSLRSVIASCWVEEHKGQLVYYVHDEDGEEFIIPLADPNSAKKAAELVTVDRNVELNEHGWRRTW